MQRLLNKMSLAEVEHCSCCVAAVVKLWSVKELRLAACCRYRRYPGNECIIQQQYTGRELLVLLEFVGYVFVFMSIVPACRRRA